MSICPGAQGVPGHLRSSRLCSDAGGRAAAILNSLTATCQQLGLDPWTYLRDVLARLPEHTADRRAELLAKVWAKSQREQVENPA